MDLLKKLWREENGQGLVEYTFVVMLAALVFWVGVKDSSIWQALSTCWAKIQDCVSAPFSCSA